MAQIDQGHRHAGDSTWNPGNHVRRRIWNHHGCTGDKIDGGRVAETRPTAGNQPARQARRCDQQPHQRSMTERESGFLCHEIRESYTYSKNPRKGRRKDCCAAGSAADYRHETSLGPLRRRKRLWFTCGQELSTRRVSCFSGTVLNRVLFRVAAHASYIGKKELIITHIEKSRRNGSGKPPKACLPLRARMF